MNDTNVRRRLHEAALLAIDPPNRVDEIRDRARSLRIRRLATVLATGAGIAVVAVGALLVQTAAAPSGLVEQPTTASPSASARPQPSTTPPTTESLEARSARLTAVYVRCVRERGFDHANLAAQVLLWVPVEPAPGQPAPTDPSPGEPWWVKTAPDIPAHIHGPCLVAVGGKDPGTSSHGYPMP